jgi:putative oxidoreductase
MKNLILIGRIIYGLPLAVFGILHFINADKMGSGVPYYFPGGIFWVYLTGVAFILASISITLNIHTKLSSLLLAIMLMFFILTIHLPGLFEANYMMHLGGMLKDLCMTGGALFISGYYSKK